MFAVKLKSCLLHDPWLLCVWEKSKPHWMYLCAEQWCFSPFLAWQGLRWDWRWAQQRLEGMQPFRGNEWSSVRCSWISIAPLLHQVLCHMKYSSFPQFCLRIWTQNFNTVGKFTSWGFKNSSEIWRWPWNSCGTTLVLLLPAASLGAVADCLLRARAWFRLARAGTKGFAWNIFYTRVCCKTLAKLNNIYVWKGQVCLMWRWGKVAKSFDAADGWGERPILKACFARAPSFTHSSPGVQFLTSKIGRLALPY